MSNSTKYIIKQDEIYDVGSEVAIKLVDHSMLKYLNIHEKLKNGSGFNGFTPGFFGTFKGIK